MTATKYTYTDYDGDKLEVLDSLNGVVVRGTDEDKAHPRVEVAVPLTELPALIAHLQAVHAEQAARS